MWAEVPLEGVLNSSKALILYIKFFFALIFFSLKNLNSLAVQWLWLCASTAGYMGLIRGPETKILQAEWRG